MNGDLDHLPVSAQAYLVLSHALAWWNLRLSPSEDDRCRQEHIVKDYLEIDQVYSLRYGLPPMAPSLQRFLNFLALCSPSTERSSNQIGFTGSRTGLYQRYDHSAWSQTTNSAEMFENMPSLYLQVPAFIDYCLSTGVGEAIDSSTVYTILNRLGNKVPAEMLSIYRFPSLSKATFGDLTQASLSLPTDGQATDLDNTHHSSPSVASEPAWSSLEDNILNGGLWFDENQMNFSMNTDDVNIAHNQTEEELFDWSRYVDNIVNNIIT